MSSPLAKPTPTLGSVPDWLEIVRSKVDGLSFGVVQIVVHDRKVTQIERTEKTRLDSPATDAPRRRENY
jgi:hypothetical protein